MWEDNIKTSLREVGCGNVDGICEHGNESSGSCGSATGSFAKRTQLHAVVCLVSYHVTYRATQPSCFRAIFSLFFLNLLFPLGRTVRSHLGRILFHTYYTLFPAASVISHIFHHFNIKL
jgi:hypothetical protein